MEEPIMFVIMDSLINKDYMRIERLYDVKGSTYSGRRTKLAPEQEQSSGLTTLKDLNFADNKDFNISASDKQELMDILVRDSQFLGNIHCIDYSLLITKIRKPINSKHSKLEDESSIMSMQYDMEKHIFL